MILLLALLVIVVAVVAILRRAEVRLTLVLAALALAGLAGKPMAIVQTFLEYLTREQFLLPIGTCMGFAYVLRATECDRHLVYLLLEPLRHVRPLLIPGVVLVGAVVNLPIISQSSTAVTVGSVLVPVLTAARLSPTTVGAALLLGSSIGGELLNPGAPELRTVVSECGKRGIEVTALDCVSYLWPLLLVHLAVAVPVFWFLCHRAEAAWQRQQDTEETPRTDFRLNPIKALVPLIPLTLLFLTALPPPYRLLHVPQAWLVPEGTARGLFETRLIGAAMLVGVVVAALLSPGKAGSTAKVFFEGAGYALTNITSLIVAASCFGKGVELVGLAAPVQGVIRAAPDLLMPLAAVFPLSFAWVSGSGMASTQSLYGFYVDPAGATGADPVRVGAVVSLAAAAGRTLSPVAAVVLMSSSLTGAEPLALVRRVVLPLLAGLTVVVLVAMALG